NAYGSKAHILNLGIYTLSLLPLSYLIVNLRSSATLNSTANGTHVNLGSTALDKVQYLKLPINENPRDGFLQNHTQSYFLTVCMFLVLALNLYAIGKEVMQIVQQRSNYFRDIANGLDWATAISSIMFVVPLLLNSDGTWHWQAGAYAVFVSWFNFLLYLQRFEHFGIYVVMFGEIMRTLFSIIMLFFFLMLAFGLSFYALMIGQIGLAVGDIAEVQKNATLKRIAMQIDLHTGLEEKLPYWFMKRVDQPKVTEYPNRKCKTKANLLYLFLGLDEKREVHTRLNTNSHQLTPVEYELQKQKYRLKEMGSVLEKQHNLLKLIIQKMEITSEAEDHDGPDPFRGGVGRQRLNRKSKWLPLVKAMKAGCNVNTHC
ncbi:hypothetical protein JZ751_003959, partial [Albula glossodonta]